MYFRLCFSFSWYDLTLIKKSHTLSFYSVFLLLVTVVAQFTAPFTSEKAMYFLSLISCSINKLKSHIFTCKSWKWLGGGGGAAPPAPPLPPPPFSTALSAPARYPLSGGVKKTGIITDLEKNAVTVAHCSSTNQFSRWSNSNFPGHESFFGISAFP